MAEESTTAQGSNGGGARSKERSPNYPAVPLSEATRLVQQIYEKEKRTAVPAEVAAKALGYTSLSGASRTVLASLRSFGLIENDGGNVRVSGLAMDLIHHPEGSPERTAALATAAMRPALIAELAQTHGEASDDALRAFLITRRGFSPEGAGRFIQTFRDALALAKPASRGYAQDAMQAVQDSPPGFTPPPAPPAAPEPRVSVLFSGLLAKGISAEVRVTGEGVRPEHVERLRKHLDLAKDALGDALDDFDSGGV
jgi:hypothetical protein